MWPSFIFLISVADSINKCTFSFGIVFKSESTFIERNYDQNGISKNGLISNQAKLFYAKKSF